MSSPVCLVRPTCFHYNPGTDWFSDLKLAADIPILSFRLCIRSDPPSVFWSMLVSAMSALPSAVRDISIVATDVVPNGFNELVRPAHWAHLAAMLARRLAGRLASFRLTFAGMDDFRLAPPARAAFSDSFNAVLREREVLFAKSGIAVAFSFIPDAELLVS